ncbi:MAG: hypothetical protein OEX07_16775, partial [Gammaproteobacteria bacterium]|nr:hypothetical protein [Gammaproteobacteria bacterium]
NNYKLPWLIAKNEDLRWPATEGEKTNWILKKAHTFSNMVARASTKNESVNYTYYTVLHMMKSPVALLHPLTLYKIFKYGRSSNKDESFSSANENKSGEPLV